MGGFGDTGALTYSLSTYNENWGWPLVLPSNVLTSSTSADPQLVIFMIFMNIPPGARILYKIIQ
jgi:hypothetical protein